MFVKKSKQCYVCEKKTKSKDIVDMSPEGTGFASASTKAMAEKFNLAFQ
jgi:nitric oxide synthase-interacting protein